MKKITLLACCLLIISSAFGWGFWAHKRINRMAVFTLPPEMLVFYKHHLDYITDHAVDPDKRRYSVPGEAFHHYIDIDHWDTYPFDKVPRRFTDALVHYTDLYFVTESLDTLHVMGHEIMRFSNHEIFLNGPNNSSIFGKDSMLCINEKTYKQFVRNHLQSLHDEHLPFWEVNVDTFLKVLGEHQPIVRPQAIFAKDRFTEYGIIPFHLPRMVHRLTNAFRSGDVSYILRVSSDLGHYVGDSHVPLHTTENYNGQMSGQRGIHGFWESRLPELFGESYNYFVGRAYFVENVQDEVWKAVLESHIALDSVLRFEQLLNDSLPPDKKYGYETRNNIVVRAYSREFSEAYHEMLGGQVERRMRMSIRRLGALWYTAWKNAGEPDLKALIGKKIKEKQQKKKPRLKIIDREAGMGILDDAPKKLWKYIKDLKEGDNIKTTLLGTLPRKPNSRMYAWMRKNEWRLSRRSHSMMPPKFAAVLSVT